MRRARASTTARQAPWSVLWRTLGPHRGITFLSEVGTELGLPQASRGTLKRWRVAFRWDDGAAAWDGRRAGEAANATLQHVLVNDRDHALLGR